AHGGVYKGRATPTATDQMRSITFGQSVEAELLAITTTHEEDAVEAKTVYILRHLRPAPPGPGAATPPAPPAADDQSTR
ncbi:MAG TPA: hypothetical protein VFE78_26125, partial [Gemmataceae bacterium]|nr:hypothetical protein [Gemmataceae bacterium]